MGFWEIFKNAIFSVINSLFVRTGDWGIAIILVTIIFRIIIFPITMRQSKSMIQMQKLQPQMKEIQEKYANDKNRQNEEISKLYQEANYNPISGCLPMLLQMPIFMALFQVLKALDSLIIQIGHPPEVLPAKFISIIPDLSKSASNIFSFTADGIFASIPYLIMILLFGATMLIPALTNRTGDQTALITTVVMSVMMMWFGWTTPAGVLLYWDTSSIIGMGQQEAMKLLNKRKEKEIEKQQIEIRPVKVDVERKERKNRPRKSR